MTLFISKPRIRIKAQQLALTAQILFCDVKIGCLKLGYLRIELSHFLRMAALGRFYRPFSGIGVVSEKAVALEGGHHDAEHLSAPSGDQGDSTTGAEGARR